MSSPPDTIGWVEGDEHIELLHALDLRRGHTFHVHERPPERSQVDLLLIFSSCVICSPMAISVTEWSCTGMPALATARAKRPHASHTPAQRSALAGRDHVSAAAAREALAVVRVVHPLVAIVIAKRGKLAIIFLRAGAASSPVAVF